MFCIIELISPHLLMCLPFLFTIAVSDEFWKTVCFCKPKSCSSRGPKCNGLPLLDPDSPNFIEQFNLARKNIKNVELYSYSYSKVDLNLDMRSLAGLTINFSSLSGKVNVNLKYVNDDEYSGCFFTFTSKNYINPSFIPIEDDKPTNTLRIGSIDSKANVQFMMNKEKNTILHFQTLTITTPSFRNLSALMKSSPGLTSLRIGRTDTLEIIFSKSQPQFKIGGFNLNFSYIQGDSFSLKGSYLTSFNNFGDKLILSFEDGVTLSDLPTFYLQSISNLEFRGKLWEPSEKNPIQEILKVQHIKIPKGPFPFSVYSDDFDFILSGDTTIYGDIDAAFKTSSTGSLNITSDLTTRFNVSFKGYVDANIILHTPYVNVYIDNYTNNATKSRDMVFPIGFCFNEESESYVYLKSAVFKGDNRNANKIVCYPVMSKSFSDEDLDNNKIFKGFYFLEMPSGSIDHTIFSVEIDIKAPTVKENLPGFSLLSNCMNATLDKTRNYRLKAFKGRSAFIAPELICLVGNSLCSYDLNKPYPYIDAESIEDGDIAPYILDGYKEIIIYSANYNENTVLDFSRLPKTGYNITILGSPTNSASEISLFTLNAIDGEKINMLHLSDLTITNSLEFNVSHVRLSHVTFSSSYEYTFSESSHVVFDIYSLNSVNSVRNKPTFPTLYLSQENNKYDSGYSQYTFSETMKIYNGMLDICLIGKSNNPRAKDIYECVRNLNPMNFQKLNYVSTRDLTIESNSMTADLHQIDLIIHPLEKLTTYKILLNGDGWETKLNNPISVDHGNYSMYLYISRPGEAEDFKIIGNGPFLYKVNYGNEQKYCFYDDPNETNSCFNDYSSKTINIETTDYSTKLSEMKNTSISINLDNFDGKYQFPLSFFDQKKVKLYTGPDFKTLSVVEILSLDKMLDKMYSLTILEDIKLSYSGSEVVQAGFGQLQINKKLEVDSKWKSNVKLFVSQLFCDYEHLNKFKNVTVDDQLVVSGTIPTEGDVLVIDFVQDNEPNDLVTNIGGNVTIVVGNEFLRIGRAVFNIKHSNNYDANFTVNSMNTNITIQCETTVVDQFVKFYINHGNYEVTYNFVGTFPTLEADDESLIVLSGGGINITTSKDLPITIKSAYMVEFHLMSSSVSSIHGPISYLEKNINNYDKSLGRIRFYNHQQAKIHLVITRGYYIESVESISNISSLMTSNIELRVPSISTMSSSINSNLTFITTIGSNGASSFIIEDRLPERILFNKIIYVHSEIKGRIEDEMKFPFVRSSETLIKARADDLKQVDFTFEYIVQDFTEAPHGFSPRINCLSIKQEKSGSIDDTIELFAAVKPSGIPFVIDFVADGQTTDGELVINDTNSFYLENLSRLLPNDFVGIVLRLRRDMQSKKPLNLDNIVAGHSKLIITIESERLEPYEAYVTLPNSKILNLTFTNLKLDFFTNDRKELLTKSVNFTDISFLNADKYVISNDVEELHMDVDSLNGLVEDKALSSFKGKMNVNSANVIVFTKDGWEFREDRSRPTTLIKASEFPNIQFSTRAFCLLMIDDPSLQSIHPFKFDAYPIDDQTVYFEVSRHWGSINDLETFKINVNGATLVSLNTASYPIPRIFDIPDSNITYTFETDIEGKFDTINLEDGRVFKDEDLSMDFQYLPSVYQYVNGDNVFFEGETNIRFRNDVGVFRTNNSVFRETSMARFSNFETLRKMEVEKGANLSGIFSFGLTSTLQLHWTLNKFPLIVHEGFTGKSPKLLEIIYDDTSVDKELYQKLLMNKIGVTLMKGNFECFKMKSNVMFGGSFSHFGDGNPYIIVVCDSSAEGQVLLLQGIKDLPNDDDDDSQSGGGGGGKVSSGGIAGIVISIAIVVGIVVAVVVYYIQRIKIDRLKNELPAQLDTRDSSIDTSVQQPGLEDSYEEI